MELMEALVDDLRSRAAARHTVRLNDSPDNYYYCSIDLSCEGYQDRTVCDIRVNESKILVRFSGRESLLAHRLMMTTHFADIGALEKIYDELERRGMINPI